MISFEEYKYYYQTYIDSIFGIREQEFEINNITQEQKNKFYNYSFGIKTLLLVAFIESNFLTKEELKKLRKFEHNKDFIPSIKQGILSCYIYIRDCVAHNPSIEILSNGINTERFLEYVDNNHFNFANVIDDKILIKPEAIKHLNKMIRMFYTETQS